MKKLYKILIIVGAIVIVTTPTVFVSVYFYIQNRVDNTDVSIESFIVNDITNDTLQGIVNFTISEPTRVAATFRVLEINLTYNTHLLGNGLVTTTEFSTQEVSHVTEFILDITDTISFSDFVDNFTEQELLSIDIDVLIDFTGALSSLPEKTISKTLEIAGLSALTFGLNSFDLLEVTDDSLHLNVTAEIYNPSPIELNITTLEADLIHPNNTLLGTISKSDFLIKSGLNSLFLDTWLTAPKSYLSEIIGNYFSQMNVSLWLNYTVTIGNFAGEGFVFNQYRTDLEIEGLKEDLLSIEVEMISLDLGGLPSTVGYTVDTIVTIHNPVNLPINITAFEGQLEYDDSDGASYSIPFVFSVSYDSLDNIFLSLVDLNWSSDPMQLGGLAEGQDTYTFSGSNIEQGVRLYNEYIQQNQLYVDIVQAKVYIQILSFEIVVPLEIYDIYVPND